MPSEWLKEMGCAPASDGNAVGPDSADGVRTSAGPRSAPPKALGKEKAAEKPTVNDSDSAAGDWIKSILSALLAVVLTGIVYYYLRGRSVAKPAVRGLLATVHVDASIVELYDYVSTADFRTEWHLGSVEISGPAIDHSAVPGEVFVEELSISGRVVTLEWNVLERQMPSSVSSQHAEFALEGLAKIEGRPSETWRQIIRLRAGQHQYAKTPHVQVELELDIGVKQSDEAGKKWRRQLSRALKESLRLLRDRLRERAKQPS